MEKQDKKEKPVKPASLILDDMKRAIWTAINEPRLPATVIEPIVGAIHRELLAHSEREIAYDRAEYEAALKAEEEMAREANENEDPNEDNG